MPRGAPQADVPSPGDPDRKRVLNILAQRRYRQRRKEKYAMLEKQAKSGSSGSGESSTSPDSNSDQSGSDAHAGSSHIGVSLPEFQTDGLYLDSTGLVTDADIDLSMNAFFDPQSLTDDSLTFTNDIIPQDMQQSYELYQPQAQHSMPNDNALDVPLLKIFRVGALVAQQLGCAHILFDPTATWIVNTPHIPGLPDNMQPTPAQLTIPHHPLFDVLPWPQLRTKLICVFALPEKSRPQNAQDSMALMQCAYDIEDASEGFRINGEGLHRDDWEIGEAFFRNWWWALDRSIVENSNMWRQKRGESRLGIRAA